MVESDVSTEVMDMPNTRKQVTMVEAAKTIEVFISGGDAPGMNTAIRAVVRTAISRDLRAEDIMYGYAGLLKEEIVDMESTNVSDIVNRGGTILYTIRYKEFIITEGQQRDTGIYHRHDIDGMVVIGGDGSFQGTGKLPAPDIDTIGLLGATDLDIACTDYTIGSNTAVNTTMEATNKVRDAPIPHERYSIVEAIGRNTRYIVLWCGIGNGAEDILLPERYDSNEQTLINRIIDNRRRGKKHNIIVNTEGIGHSSSMTKRIEVAIGIETGATILGHMQHGGTPACKDRVYASIIGTKAAELPAIGKGNRLMVYKHGEFVDFDIQEALNMTKDIPEEQYEIAKMLVR